MHLRDIRSHPLVAGLCFLVVHSALFSVLYGRLEDGAFIICNILPLVFASLVGMRWGLGYAFVHVAQSMVLGGLVGANFDRFLSTGLLATMVMIILTGAIGRIRDLTITLKRELAERQRYARELQEHRAHLESLVEERTSDLVESNERLREEIDERAKTEQEKRRLEASLKRAEKMEAIGVLAGSVAHDLNNILGSLVGYPELLLMELPEDSPQREALVAIRDSGLKASAVVQDLLTMARRGVTSAEVLSLNEVVSSLMRSREILGLKAQHPEVQITANLARGLLNIHGSANHLSRAILNLVLNAVEALEHGGQVEVSTANVYVDTQASGYEVLAEGEYVTLTVADTGTGIAPEDLDRIFEPFYTKKVMGRSGTGLGMAIVWGIVKDHGGFIDVRSEPGRGTTITLLLPSTRSRPRMESPSARIEELRGSGESILVVDDVGVQRDLCVAMLKTLRYSATAVASGEEAVEHVKRSPVDLLVLDMVMAPGIDGLETYRRIIEIHPGQKAIIASGLSETRQVKDVQALGAGAYVRKPYSLEQIAVAIRDELRKRR